MSEEEQVRFLLEGLGNDEQARAKRWIKRADRATLAIKPSPHLREDCRWHAYDAVLRLERAEADALEEQVSKAKSQKEHAEQIIAALRRARFAARRLSGFS